MTATRTYVVMLTHDGDDDEFDALFAQYLTLPDCPFLEDYGPRSEELSGWTGPFIEAVTVSRDRIGHPLAHWRKP